MWNNGEVKNSWENIRNLSKNMKIHPLKTKVLRQPAEPKGLYMQALNNLEDTVHKAILQKKEQHNKLNLRWKNWETLNFTLSMLWKFQNHEEIKL